MNFAKTVALCWLVSSIALAKGEFSVTGGPGQTNVDQLKHLAVVTWLRSNNYKSYAENLTYDAAEKYILVSKASRTSGNRMVLSGTLDIDALQHWVRMAETKRGATTFKPMLVLTSSLPGMTISAAESGARTRESALGQVVLAETTGLFQKFAAKVDLPSGSVPVSGIPKAGERDMATFRDYANSHGHNTALWVHFSPCKSCGGSRIDFFLFNLTHGRQALVRSDDLNLSGGDMVSPARIKSALKGPFQQFRMDLEDAVSEGTLFCAAHRLIIEGIEGYRTYKAIEFGFAKTDFISLSQIKRAAPQTAEFEILSPLESEEVSQRLEAMDFGGFRMKSVRVDHHLIIMRYFR